METHTTIDSCPDIVIVRALVAMIYAPSWAKTQKIIEEQQRVLLLDRALELLSFTIVTLYLQGELEDAKNLAQYEEILAQARKFGVEFACKNFMPR